MKNYLANDFHRAYFGEVVAIHGIDKYSAARALKDAGQP
jgi:hypothetical protein